MKKVVLDNLPRKIFRGKECIDWVNSIGYKVKFIYDDIEGEILILKIISNRKISISDELIDVLNKERQSQSENKELLGKHYIDNDYVIVMENGKPYRPNYLSELFTKFINDNNLPPITLHGLRHSLASVANNAGINLYEISKILGHSNTSTTSKIYISMFDDTHKESMDAIVNEFKNDKDEDSG